jgi:hypothetical protein
MQPWAWVLLIVVLVVVVILVAVLTRQRRTANLRDRFGPEYDRTIDTADDKRGAEQELLDRARRREKLDIRPLPEAARARYADQWRGIQERFIDDPAGSVGAAHSLLDQVMAERGYPTKDFEEQADLVSVDHPQVVDNYRAAYGVYQRQRTGQASTEDLRDALVRYRSLFEDLLRPESGAADSRAGDRTDMRADDRGDDYRSNGPAAGVTDSRYDDGAMDGRGDLSADQQAFDQRASDQRADGLRETRPDVGPSSTTYGERP